MPVLHDLLNAEIPWIEWEDLKALRLEWMAQILILLWLP
jgi:hypothetical protein